MQTIEGFLQQLQITNASTTYTRKRSQLKAFLRYLAEQETHYANATKQTIEAYLQQLSGTQFYKQQTCQVIRE